MSKSLIFLVKSSKMIQLFQSKCSLSSSIFHFQSFLSYFPTNQDIFEDKDEALTDNYDKEVIIIHRLGIVSILKTTKWFISNVMKRDLQLVHSRYDGMEMVIFRVNNLSFGLSAFQVYVVESWKCQLLKLDIWSWSWASWREYVSISDCTTYSVYSCN